MAFPKGLRMVPSQEDRSKFRPSSFLGTNIISAAEVNPATNIEIAPPHDSRNGHERDHARHQKPRRRSGLSYLRMSLVKRQKSQATKNAHNNEPQLQQKEQRSNEMTGYTHTEKENLSTTRRSGASKGEGNSKCRSTRSNINLSTPSTGKLRNNTRRSSLSFLRKLSVPIMIQRPRSGNGSDRSKATEDTHEHETTNDDEPKRVEVSKSVFVDQTRVVAFSGKRHRRVGQQEGQEQRKLERVAEEKENASDDHRKHQSILNAYTPQFECSTAILQHSYLERICGVGYNPSDSTDGIEFKPDLSEDPTVQESIECIFSSQLQDGLELWDDEELNEEGIYADRAGVVSSLMFSSSSSERLGSGSGVRQEFVPSSSDNLVSPADLQQSRMNRNDRKGSSSFSMKQTKKRYEQASLVYVGTFDPTVNDDDSNVRDEDRKKGIGCITAGVDDIKIPEDPLPCHCAKHVLPAIHPKDWPQAPLLLRPTPGSGTRVKGVRFCKDSPDEPLWVPGSHLSWSERLARKWGTAREHPHFASCEKCAVLPINNGNEEEGHSLVVDFESDLFEGSLLLRLRHSNGTTRDPYDDRKGYFMGVNRRYQACVRGRFKKSLPLTEMVTGFRLNRKCGKLPAKWVLRGGLKVVSFFAPQLDAKLEGENPHSLTPLGSTPQAISVDYHAMEADLNLLEGKCEEPIEAHRTLLGESFAAPTSLQRAKMRKKAFDKLFVQQNKSFQTDPSKVYTFEFLQHLFNFEDFSIELGSMLGSVQLEEVLDGQPLQIMAAHKEQPLWSFDVWHECLWERAKLHDDLCHTNK